MGDLAEELHQGRRRSDLVEDRDVGHVEGQVGGLARR